MRIVHFFDCSEEERKRMRKNADRKGESVKESFKKAFLIHCAYAIINHNDKDSGA